MESDFIQIDKLSAARRQLQTAIYLFYHEKDIIAIHTLAAAAYEILEDIAKQQGILGSSFQRFIESLNSNSELRKEFIIAWRKPQNFFKHADKDSEEIIKLNPKQAQLIIYDSLLLYRNLKNDLFQEGVVFNGWFLLKYRSEFIKNDPESEKQIPLLNLNPDDKQLWINLL